MQYLTQHPSKGTQQKRVCTNASHVCRWSIAAGKRPVPFRTRKLSLHTLMVLQPGGCGRVSHRRHQTTNTTKYKQEEEDGTPPPSSFVVLLASPAGTSRRSQHARVGLRLLHRFIHNCLRPTRRPHITRTAYGSASLAVGNQPSTCPFTPAAMRAATPGLPAGLGRPNRT